MISNIPIFRAKKIDSNEYIEGFYVEVGSAGRIYNNDLKGYGAYLIDQSTLSMHFPSMIDSQRNKIFASLREDGKGGSIANYDNKGSWIAMYIENAFMWINVKDMQKIGTKEPVSFLRLKPLAKMIVTGIQE